MEQQILLVDDDQQTLIFLEQVLRSTGVKILTAEDGVQALDILQALTPSIVLLDMFMPQVSGFELLDFIQQTPRLNGTYAVVVSAHNHFPPSDVLSRVDAYLVKPIRPKELRDTVQRAIGCQTAV